MSVIYVPQRGVSSPGLFYTPAEKIRFYSDGQETRERILSASSLFWGISTNEPLNEHLLYSSRLSWGKNIEEEQKECKMARGSKDWNKKSTMSLQTHSCQIHKRCAIFRLMAINTSSELQHSSNLYFHESSFFSSLSLPPLFLQRTALSLTLLWHMRHCSVIQHSCTNSCALCTKQS